MEKLKIKWGELTVDMGQYSVAQAREIFFDCSKRVKLYVELEQEKLDGWYDKILSRLESFYDSLENRENMQVWDSSIPSNVKRDYAHYKLEVEKSSERASELYSMFLELRIPKSKTIS